jgi:diguanylate cyclase (GGDEF)-like protein
MPSFGPLVPTFFLLGAAAQFATFALLAVVYRRSPRRARAILAAMFAGGTVISLVSGISLPSASGGGAAVLVVLGGAAAEVWRNALWTTGAAIGALVYARLRDEQPLAPVAARRTLRLAVVVVLGVVLLALAATVLLRAQVPDATSVAGLRGRLLAPTIAALCVLGTFAMMRAPLRDTVDLGGRWAIAIVTLGVLAWIAEAHRFDGAWYLARAAWLGAILVMLIAVFRELQALPLYAEETTPDASAAERHSRRLEMLWRLAATEADDDASWLRTLLGEAAHVVRDGASFHGLLAHVDEHDLVVDATTISAIGTDVPAEGSRYPLAGTLMAEARRHGGTIGWADVKAERRLARVPRVRAHDWRAFIASPFHAGGVHYFVAFVSFDPLAEPFGESDRAYVELLASLCASRLHERAQDDRLRYHSEHDAVTGLPNRVAFRAQGERWLREGRPLAVVVVDVDRFRELNDTLGHKVGDTILRQAGAALAEAASSDEIVARLGGDSFGVLVPDGEDRAALEARLLRFLSAFSRPLATGVRSEEHVAVTASFGVAVAPGDGTNFEQLLARADTAVFVAKEQGRARWAFFESRVETQFALARGLRNEIVEAVERNEFVLYFQPHVELDSGRVAGAEALIRWNHPVRGFLPPAEFIPFAESHGLAGLIGEWVLRETVRVAQRVRELAPGFRIWFNLSAEELSDPAMLARLRRIEGDLTCVGVEVTETAAMRDVDRTVYAIDALREAGLAIALDDFGTGYSSLAHLKRLQLDLVKIDRSFVAGIPADTHDIAIVEAVISIAKRYGFETVAEGVETFPQVAFLAAGGCTYGQGFVYARPMPESVFAGWLSERRVRITA